MLISRLFSRSLLSPKVEQALNAQIAVELSASLTYMKVSSWYDSKNLTNISKYFRDESNTEKAHAEQIIDYINKRNGNAIIPAVAPLDVKLEKHDLIFQQVLEIEKSTEKSLHAVVLVAKEEGDVATEVALQGLVLDQVNSIAEVDAMVEEIDTFANMQGLIWHFDKEMI